MRGIIISPPFEANGQALKIISTNIEPVKLRQYLLYWDKIDFPDSNLISVGSNPDIKYLESTGDLIRTKVGFDSFSGNACLIFPLIQAKAFELNIQKKGEQWSVAQSSHKLFFPNNISSLSNTIEVDLYNCIPIPSGDVPLSDILEFKFKRKDELMEFRIMMDELYLRIINSADTPSAKSKIMDRINYNISTLNKVMSESKIKRLIGSVKAELNISNLVLASLTGISLKEGLSIPIDIATLLGITASTINVSIKTIPKLNSLPEDLKAYAYLYYAERELI